MLNFFSRHRYKIAVLVGLLLIPVVLLECMKDKVRAEGKTIVEVAEIFNTDRQLTGENREKMMQFHLHGSGLATSMLMVAAERRGDIKERDQLFYEGVKVGTNRSMYLLMSSNGFLFSEKVRQENKRALDSATSDDLRQDLAKQQTSTLPVEDQQMLYACFDRLNGRYQGVWQKTLEVKDFFFDTRSCDFSNTIRLATKE